MRELIYRQVLGDMVLLYVGHQGLISLLIVPAKAEKKVDFATNLAEDGMIQVSLAGDKHFRHYCGGQTLRNGECAEKMRAVGQTRRQSEKETEIVTEFISENRIKVSNIIRYREGYKFFSSENIYTNVSEKEIIAEMTVSFCISGISPFAGEEPPLVLHRLRGNWSAEGRESHEKFESIGLEQSWADYGVRLEKFGSIGSMPVQKYFPFVCVEDTKNKVSWGAFMEAPCSWQMEVFRYNKNVCISGGPADYEYGHERHLLRSGESFASGRTFLTVCGGGFEDVCNRLNAASDGTDSEKEAEMPIIYNEYCTSWGAPTEEEVGELIDVAKAFGAEYFVIDSGWYCSGQGNWALKVGDYEVNEEAFPSGIAQTTDKIRAAGMTAGLWFEPEIAAEKAKVYRNDEMFLTRDGQKIVMQDRSFFDFRLQSVREYLRKKVIGFLRDNGFRYVKLDYNECLGIGCDGAESYGAALRAHIDGVLDFMRELKAEIPGLILEVCSAGGHRIEPAFLRVADMISFSDAHEVAEGAVVAANVNRLCPSSKNQIWAVVRREYTDAETRYSLAKTFYGRMCLSGDLKNIREEQRQDVQRAVGLYKQVRYILKDSALYIFGDRDQKYRALRGWQAGLKIAADGSGALLIVHSFRGSGEIAVRHKSLCGMEIEGVFAAENCVIRKEKNAVYIKMDDFDGCVVHLRKK